jgi:hypothetical protein
MKELDLTKVYKRIEVLVKNKLREQSPDGPEPGAPLRNSITVRVEETKDGFAFVTGYLTYGRFLDLGTERYFKGERPDAKWNPNPGKGRRGIKPRYWTNLGKPTEKMIADLVAKEIAKQAKAIISGK